MAFIRRKSTAAAFMILCILAAVLIGGWRGTSQEYQKIQEAFSGDDSSPKQYLDTMLVRFGYLVEMADTYGIQTEKEKSVYQMMQSTITEAAVTELKTRESSLYAKLKQQPLEEEDASYMERDHTMFVSAAASLSHLDYNQQAMRYNAEMNRFPASFFQSLYGYEDALVFQ